MAKYFGREKICESFLEKDSKGKTLNIGAGEILWLENDIFLGKRNLGKQNLAKRKMIIDATAIPFKKNELSQVIILDVLEHIENDNRVLDEINRVLKTGGTLVISVPNDTILSLLNPIRYIQHKRHYTLKQISELLNKKGFKIEKLFVGGGISELIDLYVHLILKYTIGKKIHLQIFNKFKDRKYKNHTKTGNEIIIKARKI